MPFCPECGTPIKENHKFCPSCGARQEPIQGRPAIQSTPPTLIASQSPPPTSVPPQYVHPQQNVEEVKCVIPNLMIYKGLGRYDTFNLLVTERRSIFSKLTNDMMSKSIKKRRDKADMEGKGFFGKWKAQMQGFNTYCDYYEGMTLDQIISENKDNFSVDNTSIRGFKIRDESGDDMASWYGVEIQTIGKSLKYRIQYDPTEAFNAAYGLHIK